MPPEVAVVVMPARPPRRLAKTVTETPPVDGRLAGIKELGPARSKVAIRVKLAGGAALTAETIADR
jgi:hypothetical protein